MNHSLTAFAARIILFAACKKDDDPAPPSGGTPAPAVVTVTDIDGNVYNTVLIDGDRWMKENLRTSRYRNGDVISTDMQNAPATMTGACGYPGNDPANNTIYGKLYNGYAVGDARGICPAGWHMPTDADWIALEMSLGMPLAQTTLTQEYRGATQNVGGKLKATTLWDSPNTGATNSSGFNALPAGYYMQVSNGYSPVGSVAYFLSSTDAIPGVGYFLRGLSADEGGIDRNMQAYSQGFSCRCVQD